MPAENCYANPVLNYPKKKTKQKKGLLQASINFPKPCYKPILNTQKGGYLAPRVCAAGQSGEGGEGRQTEELLQNNPM